MGSDSQYKAPKELAAIRVTFNSFSEVFGSKLQFMIIFALIMGASVGRDAFVNDLKELLQIIGGDLES